MPGYWEQTIWDWLGGLSTTYFANRIAWKEPNGTTTVLNDGTTYSVLQGVDGRWMPPFEATIDNYFSFGGSISKTRKMKVKPRSILLPMVIKGANWDAVIANARILQKKFNPTLGEGTLVFYDSASRTFVLRCHLLEMVQGETGETETRGKWMKVAWRFLAHVPHYFNPTKQSRVLDWNSPVTATNNGDTITWPYITIVGPSASAATTIYVYNGTLTGSPRLTLSGCSLTSGHHIDINFQPNERSIVYDDTTDWRKYVSANSIYFYLTKGANSITLYSNIAGSDAVPTMYWYERYNGV